MTGFPDNWEKPQKILVILAHPDDPEFFCGATLYRWAHAGHEIHYALFTCGEKGGSLDFTPDVLCTTRRGEQEKAANVIGVKSIRYLGYDDGYLIPSLDLRREIVRIVRQDKPDVIVTCDPTNLFPFPSYGINHPDHRAAGQIVLDAVFPASGNVHYFPDLFTKENLAPHTPREVWVSLTANPTVTFDITDLWDIKLRALRYGRSPDCRRDWCAVRVKEQGRDACMRT